MVGWSGGDLRIEYGDVWIVIHLPCEEGIRCGLHMK